MKKIIAIVSARGGSKGVPKKNIKSLNGYPLIYYTLKTLKKAKRINKIILSSDSDNILNVARGLNLKIDLNKRPSYLAKDSTPLTSVVQYESKRINDLGYKHDYVLQISPASPFLSLKTINDIIDLLLNKNSCVVTLKRIEHEHPYRAKYLKKNNSFKPFIKNINVEKFISRQDLPTLYCTSGSVYARSYKLLSTFTGKDFCLGSSPVGVVVNDIEAINIDRKIDFDFANFVMKNKKKYEIK
jgi:CMP-N,N'-diacetyllegionaminic acid synthase